MPAHVSRRTTLALAASPLLSACAAGARPPVAGPAALERPDQVAMPDAPHPPDTLATAVAASEPGSVAPDAASAAVAAGGQIRALWVDAFHEGAKSPQQVRRLVAEARAAGINTLIVQVRRRGDAYYVRTAEPRTEDPALQPGFDVLQAVLDAARAVHPPVEVHAWLATVAIWNQPHRPPADPAHAFNRHGPDAPEAECWLSLDDRGQAWDGSNYMLDPGHPAAARYMAAVAGELVREYDVDGLHLDLIRYAGARWGYNPTSVARFNAGYGADGRPAANEPRWQQWRRQQVTALVRRIYLDCLALRPRLTISAATIGWGSGPTTMAGWRATNAYRDVFQDWIGWLDAGIVDVALPMTYNDERNPQQRAWFDEWTAWARAWRGRRQVAAGIGLFLNEPAGSLAQVQRALAPGAAGALLDGVALYSYANTNAPLPGGTRPATPNADMLRAFSASSPLLGDAPPPFAEPAAPPPRPWKATEAHLRGLATSQGVALDGATIRLDGPIHLTLESDGDGYFGAAGLPPGTYQVRLEHGAARAAWSVSLAPGRVTTLTPMTG